VPAVELEQTADLGIIELIEVPVPLADRAQVRRRLQEHGTASIPVGSDYVHANDAATAT